MAQTYTESFLNEESAHDGRSYSLYRVLTLMAQTYTKSLLNDGSAHDGRFTAYIGSSPIQLRPIRSHS